MGYLLLLAVMARNVQMSNNNKKRMVWFKRQNCHKNKLENMN